MGRGGAGGTGLEEGRRSRTHDIKAARAFFSSFSK